MNGTGVAVLHKISSLGVLLVVVAANILATEYAVKHSFDALAVAEGIKCFIAVAVIWHLTLGSWRASEDVRLRQIGNALVAAVALLSLIGDSAAMGFLNR